MEWVHIFTPVLLSVFFGALIFSAYTDIKFNKIYNWVTYPAIILGFIFRIVNFGAEGFISSLFGAFIGFIFLFVFFMAGGIGAGDVKLLTAVGAFGGSQFTLWTLYYSAIIGGILGIFLLIFKGIFLFNATSITPLA